MRAPARAALLAVLTLGALGRAVAQPPNGRQPGAEDVPDRRGAPGGRPGLERLARAIQQNLRLDDAQAAQLRSVSGRYAGRRQALVAQEREARRALRQELRQGDDADQARVGRALTALLDAQRRRVALLGDEQRDLSAFLTPVQRARFLALQERALRAAQRARLQREAADARDQPAGVGPFE